MVGHERSWRWIFGTICWQSPQGWTLGCLGRRNRESTNFEYLRWSTLAVCKKAPPLRVRAGRRIDNPNIIDHSLEAAKGIQCGRKSEGCCRGKEASQLSYKYKKWFNNKQSWNQLKLIKIPTENNASSIVEGNNTTQEKPLTSGEDFPRWI